MRMSQNENLTENRDYLAPRVKHAGGRPTDYRDEFCDLVIDFGRMGMSNAEMANAFDCTRETLNEWAKKHPEFSDAFTRAKLASLAWWEDKARSGLLMGSAFNSALYAKAMSGRFPAEPYRDRVEVTGKDGNPIEIESPRRRLADKIASLAGKKGEDVE